MTSTLAALTLTAAVSLTGHHSGQVTRERGPLYCGPTYCHRQVTITRPFLDTGATMVVVKTHARPVESRNSLPAPWGPWHVLWGYIR